jgi:pimeloyl-ACP methyl ester carboxylesterase
MRGLRAPRWCALVLMMGISRGLAAEQSTEVAPQAPGRLIDIGGRRLHLNCTGDGSPTVVVENGGGAFSIDWDLVQSEVAKTTRICTYDRAGYAWSDPGPLRDLPEQTIADFELLLRIGDVRAPYVLVGQSIGGILVRDYQRRLQDAVAGLVLVDPTHDEGLAYVINGQPRPISLVSRSDLQEFMRELMAKPSTPPALPAKLSSPFDRLPTTLQPVRLWAERLYFADQDRNRTPYIAEGQRQEFIALRQQRLSATHPLGVLPLVVLTNGDNKQKEELSALSQSGALVVVKDSCHEIQLCSPGPVIDAIRRVVSDARSRLR